MGSQSVTDFSAARKARIRRAIRSGDSWSAGSEAIHAFSETGNFVQALESASVKEAGRLLGELVSDFEKTRNRRQVDQAFEKYGVGIENSHPFSTLAANLQKKLDERLSITSRNTDSAFAAKDALSRIVMEVLSAALSRRKEPVDASRKEVWRGLQRARPDGLNKVFLRNVIASLLAASLEAARGSIPRARVKQVVKEVRAQLAPKLGDEIAGQPGWMFTGPAKSPTRMLSTPALTRMNKILRPKDKRRERKKGKDEG